MKMWLSRLLGLLVLCLFIFMAVVGRQHLVGTTKFTRQIYRSRMRPTILVPGSSATQERFNSMVSSLNKTGKKHSLLKLTVKKDNKISYSGHLAANDEQPYIVIAFEDNTDSYTTIKKQAKWLQLALTQLQKKYRFRSFNAIGHSNGGLDWTLYLEKYYDDSSFHMMKLMTIGSPYNFELESSSHRTQMLTDLIANREELPEDLTVYNVAGTNSYDGDYIVPIASVESGKYIFQKQVKHYTQITVTGDDAQHSDLPQNEEVLALISEHILNIKMKGNKSIKPF